MAYYRVVGDILETIEEYIKAKNKKEAIERAEDNVGNWIENASVEKISKKEYKENAI